MIPALRMEQASLVRRIVGMMEERHQEVGAVVILEGAGHFIQEDAPGEVAAAIRRRPFLTLVAGATGGTGRELVR